ncbi:MAG: hypothetical protein WBD27_15460 [Pyrinomonadaceae bacterium]
MKNPEIEQNKSTGITADPYQKGTAIVLALFVLALMSVFVALAVSRTTSEAVSVGNETSEARTLYAAQGSLETMTRNFNKVFETKLNPLPSDITLVENGNIIPGLSQALGGQYTFVNTADQTSVPGATVLSGGPYSGLYAIRDNWRLRTVATNQMDGTQIQLTRSILNNRIPIFQFGIFYNDDLELFRPPRFSFGGRVHSNGNFFLSPGAEGIYFDSRVTASGHIVTQSWRNWNQSDAANSQTWIKNASNTFVQLVPTAGSVLNTTFGSANNVFQFPPAAPTPVPTPNPDLPPSRLNPTWTAQSAVFDGNLRAQVPPLNLPLNVGRGTDLVEMVKRGKELATAAGGDLFNNAGVLAPVTAAADVDNVILRSERFANKTGIRVSLADSKAKLPGCASGAGVTPVATPCGVRLDGDINGQFAAAAGTARGYQPKSMRSAIAGAFNYTATRVNGDRLFNNGREVWIKVETVQTNAVTQAIVTSDITEDILSLGMTEEIPAPSGIAITGPTAYAGTPSSNGTSTAPSANITATVPQTASTFPDSRSIIKIQTFAISGPAITTAAAPNNLLTPYTTGGNPFNIVRRYRNVTDANVNVGCVAVALPNCAADDTSPVASSENLAHMKRATVNGTANEAIVPFPIEMFDTREGTYFDNIANTPAAPQVSRNGVMSMINIDIANLRRFLRGDFNGLFPEGAVADPNSTPFSRAAAGNLGVRACTFQIPSPTPCDIPENGGWVLYVSDRRGDGNFDGEYDMEDVYGANPGNNNALDPGEDLDGPTVGGVGFVPRFGAGVLDTKYIDPANPANCAPSPIVVPANCEAARYSHSYTADRAAVSDHPYYRRGVRLINGTTVPGIYDAAVSANTKGFTVSSENGIYVQGNYNATGASAPPALGNTPFNQYFPLNTPTHIPASIVADAVTILSNGWSDARSFTSPYSQANRVATGTQMRFALITGDTISTRQNAVNQGSSVNGQNENGGVHNFKRFLEVWSGVRLDYSGSLINLFNSRNNNGSFKCCNTVYNPPIRNWVFDSTFLDPGRIPPGTPFFQYVQTTGFERSTQ